MARNAGGRTSSRSRITRTPGCSRNSATGATARGWLNKQSGEHWLFNSGLGAISPRFDTNDIGFMSRADVINAHLGGGYQWQNLTPWRKYANVLGALFASRDFDGNTIWG